MFLSLISFGCTPRQAGSGSVSCTADTDCNDGLFCTGEERCLNGRCVSGTSPCAAGMRCVEEPDGCGQACESVTDCDDDLFCTGEESCGVAGVCEAGDNPCPPGQLCDESADRCIADDGTNVPPVVKNQHEQTAVDRAITITLTGMDANGDDLTLTVIDPPSHGVLGTIDNNAADQADVVYTPEAGFTGSDSFTYQGSDGQTASDPAEVTIDVVDSAGTGVRAYVTFLGGAGEDTIRDVAFGADGPVHAVGGTASTDFPVTPGAFQSQRSGGGSSLGRGGPMDAFVVKLDSNGRIVWSTYLGGPNYDRAYAVEVDDAGNVYVAGRAGDGFPTTSGVVQPSFAGDLNANDLYGTQDGFIAKLDTDGRLLWSTYFGGDDRSFIRDLDIDDEGDIYVALGDVTRANPHVTNGAFMTSLPGGKDGVVAKVSGDGSRVIYATYFGGSDDESGQPSLRVDGDGQALALFGTVSTDAPVTPGAAQPTFGGGIGDQLLAKFKADGSGLVYCTYLGGDGAESTETHSLGVDGPGNAYVAVSTSSLSLPVTAGVAQPQHAGGVWTYGGDAVIAKFSPDGAILALTYFGGSGREGAEGVSVDDSGRVIISGTTTSTDLPVTSDAIQGSGGGGEDMFAAALSADFSRFYFATYSGGGAKEGGRCSAVRSDGLALVLAGHTASTDVSLLDPVQGVAGGGTDGLLVQAGLHPVP